MIAVGELGAVGGRNGTEQLYASPEEGVATRLQLSALKTPPAMLANLAVPVGLLAPEEALSWTFAVHVSEAVAMTSLQVGWVVEP